MTFDELEQELKAVEEKMMDKKLIDHHARWVKIPAVSLTRKLISTSAALAWLDHQSRFEQGTIIACAHGCSMYHGNEVTKTSSESPKEFEHSGYGVANGTGKPLSLIVVENSELVDSPIPVSKSRSLKVNGQ